MEPVHRSSLVDLTEEAILDGLRSGRWRDSLPGVRLLCKSLGVSTPTLRAALSRLVASGVLVSQGPRRRLLIRTSTPPDSPNEGSTRVRPPGIRRVLVISNDHLNQLPHRYLQILSQLRVAHLHWDVSHRVLPILDARRPRRAWKELVDTEEPDNIIVFGGTQVFARWALRRGFTPIFIGGFAGDLPVPCIGPSPLPIIESALAELIHLGHQDICAPLLGVFPELEAAIRRLFREKMEEHGLPFSENWNTPASRSVSPDILANMLTRVSARRLPTAFLVLKWAELLTVESFLRERKLSVPGDVSIILLLSVDVVDWFRPRLTHFTHPVGGIVKIVGRWVDGGIRQAATVRVKPKLVRGESVAPPRSS